MQGRDRAFSLRETFRRQPALPAACLIALGIAASTILPLHPFAYLLLATGFLVTAVINFYSVSRGSICLCLAICLLGMTTAQIQRNQFDRNDIARFVGQAASLAELNLTLLEPPRLIHPPDDHPRALPPHQVALARVNAIRGWEGWLPADGALLLRLDEPHPALADGQTFRAFGSLQAIAGPMNPGEMDWRDFYRLDRIQASLHIPHVANVSDISAGPFSWLAALRFKVGRALAMGFTNDQSIDLALLQGLLLGDRNSELQSLKESFLRTGTSHHLAISGMHVVVLCGFVYFLCRLIRLSPRTATWIATGFVILYGLLVIPSASVTRSVLLFATIGVAMLGRRRIDLLQLLSLVAVVMLMFRPLDLFTPAFQLSFGTVLGLFLIVPWISQLREPEMAPRRQRHPLVQYIRTATLQAIYAGMVAWVIAMPLVAYHFERVNPWAIVTSILMSPVVFMAIIGSAIKVILTLALPGLAWIWAGMAVIPAIMLRHVVEWFATWPLTDLPLKAPPLWLLVVFYVLLLAIPYIGRISIRAIHTLRLLPAALCLIAIFLPMLLGAGRTSQHELRVTILSVGAGSCAVVQLPDGRTIIIDAGSSSASDLARRTIGPYLRQAGIRSIDSVWISHANFDHFGAVPNLLQDYSIDRLMVTSQFVQSAETYPIARNLLTSAAAGGSEILQISTGSRSELSDYANIDVLWPAIESSGLADNETSMVLKIGYAGRSILFTGDIQSAAQSALLQEPSRLHTDVLIAPHHGSSEKTTADFIAAVAPGYIVSSNDRTLSTKQIAFESLIGQTPLYRTHATGAVTVIIEEYGSLRIETFRH